VATTTAGTRAAAVNRVPIYALLAANAVSIVGNMLTLVALPWFVLETTGSAARTGMVGFFVALPAFIAGIFGGTLVDRIGYRRMSVISDIVSGIGVAMVPLLYLTVGLTFWQLLLFVFIGALLDVPGVTARRAMLPELAQLGRLRLEQVNSAFEGIQYLSLLLGPPLAGLLIGWVGAEKVLWIDAATFAVSAACVALFVPATRGDEQKAARGRYLDELLAGLRFLRGDRLLLSMAVSVAVGNFVGSAVAAVLYPVFAKETYGEAMAFGLMAAAFGVGGLAGAVVFGAYGHRLPRRALWITAFMLEPVLLWPLVLTSSLPVILGALAFGALFSGPVNALMVTIRHERIPPDLRGRVFSTFSAITAVVSPLGILIAGYTIEGFGVNATVVGMAVAMHLLALALLFVPAFREMDARRGQEAFA
jgi:MFS family permease